MAFTKGHWMMEWPARKENEGDTEIYVRMHDGWCLSLCLRENHIDKVLQRRECQSFGQSVICIKKKMDRSSEEIDARQHVQFKTAPRWCDWWNITYRDQTFAVGTTVMDLKLYCLAAMCWRSAWIWSEDENESSMTFVLRNQEEQSWISSMRAERLYRRMITQRRRLTGADGGCGSHTSPSHNARAHTHTHQGN